MNANTSQDKSGITFAAQNGDSKGIVALRELKLLGYDTQRFDDPAALVKPYVAVFGVNTDSDTLGQVGKGGYYLRTAAHRLDVPGITPDWALKTPYRIGVFRTQDRGPCKVGRTPSTLNAAIKGAAKAYDCWTPGIEGWPAPWTWTTDEFPAKEHKPQFEKWQEFALRLLGTGDALSVLKALLPKPIYFHSKRPELPSILFLGCATSNKPHTDVAKIPDSKALEIVQFCSRLIRNLEGKVSEVVFSVVSTDFLEHEMLRTSLHPFYFCSVAEIESRLEKPFEDTRLRLWGRNHKRSDWEIAEALQFADDHIKANIVQPIASAVNVPVRSAKWSEVVPSGLLDEAWEEAMQMDSLERLYNNKLEVQDSWRILDQFDHEYAMKRLRANAGIYLALAKLLKERKNTAVVDFEVYTPYWNFLAKQVLQIWDGEEYTVIPVPGNVKQPWTY